MICAMELYVMAHPWRRNLRHDGSPVQVPWRMAQTRAMGAIAWRTHGALRLAMRYGTTSTGTGYGAHHYQ